MQHIFISYKHEDLDFVENLIARLKEAGFSTWEDRRIAAGAEWQTAIDTTIRNAYALIVIMTPEAKTSEYVTYEWAFAWGIGTKVIPIMLRPTQLHPRLEALQYLDFTSVRSWPWDQLIQKVQTASQKTQTAPTSSNTQNVHIPPNTPPGIQKAIIALDSGSQDERSKAISTLRQGHPSLTRNIFIDVLQHPFTDVRIHAAENLGEIGGPTAVPSLCEALKDDNWIVRKNAAQALGTIKDPAAVSALTIALKDEDSRVRQSATQALGELKDPAAVPAFIQALKDADSYIRGRAAQALGAIKDPTAVPSLCEALKDDNWIVRKNAAQALGAIKDPAAVPLLIEALKDKDNSVRQSAAQALRTIRDVN